MGGASSYYAMLCICAFLSAAWAATKVSRLIGISSIVLEIATGVVLGPRVLQLIDDEYAMCEHMRHSECEAPADIYERIRLDEPLGDSLDRIAGMDYCDRLPYLRHEGREDLVHLLEHGVGPPGPGGAKDPESSHAHQDPCVTGRSAGCRPKAPEQTTRAPVVQGHEGPWATTEAPTMAPQQDNSSETGPLRRLSGGGGGSLVYDTYQQCLEMSCEQDVAHHCSLTPDIFTLIGHAGVALMIFESGMHFDFEKAREVGFPACVVAVVGTILPLAVGSALVVLYGKPLMPAGISAGTALAPTSVGISLRLLDEAGVLQEKFGQAIITAAFVDDILSLVLFNILFSLGGEFNPVPTIVFPLVGIAFMLLAMAGAVKCWPRVIDEYLMPRVPQARDESRTGLGRLRLTKDEILFLLMIVVLVVYATITHLLGTHLWGCFIAGMSFACLQPVGHAHHVWVKQTKRVTSWMVRIFFACTVAFSIPVAQLFSWMAFLKGSLMGVVACILTKVCCALRMGPERWVIGWAMVGRAEFAYLIAQMAASARMVDQETFSIIIWALLYATIAAPFVFRFLLNRYITQYGLSAKVAPEAGQAYEEKGPKSSDKDGVRLRDVNHIDLVGEPEDEKKRGFELEGQLDESGEDDEYELPVRAIFAPMGGSKARPGIGNGIFPGANRRSTGFLCCLFFKRIVEH